jgi:predicted RNase H-like nuclease
MKFEVKSWIINPDIRKTVSFKIDFENYEEIIFVAINRLKYILMKHYSNNYDFSLLVVDLKTNIERKKVLIKAQLLDFKQKEKKNQIENEVDETQEEETDEDNIEYEIL